MSNSSKSIAFSRWPNRVAKLLAVVVFPLIWVGGLVTTSDAGMAVPDWPNTYNYNMFAYPIRDWFFGPWDLFVEHGHRLLGSLAGIISIFLCAFCIVFDRRKFVRFGAIFVLGMVIAQGLLGGLRVIQDARLLAMVHGCAGPAVFAAVVAMIVFTSKWWVDRTAFVRDRRLWSTDAHTWAAGLVLLVSYMQLVLGANLRHVPDMASPSVYYLLLVAHVVMAAFIAIMAGVIWRLAGLENWSPADVRGSARFLVAIVAAQIGLGLTTYVVKFGFLTWVADRWRFAAAYIVPEKTFWQVNLITMHAATGSLILATATYHLLRACRAKANAAGADVAKVAA